MGRLPVPNRVFLQRSGLGDFPENALFDFGTLSAVENSSAEKGYLVAAMCERNQSAVTVLYCCNNATVRLKSGVSAASLPCRTPAPSTPPRCSAAAGRFCISCRRLPPRTAGRTDRRHGCFRFVTSCSEQQPRATGTFTIWQI